MDDARRQEVSASTVNREDALLKHIFSTASLMSIAQELEEGVQFWVQSATASPPGGTDPQRRTVSAVMRRFRANRFFQR